MSAADTSLYDKELAAGDEDATLIKEALIVIATWPLDRVRLVG